MSDKARELLTKVLKHFDETLRPLDKDILIDAIRAYLAEPEKKQEPLSGEEIGLAFIETGFDAREERLLCFLRGVDFAEKHHLIGERDE